MSAKSVIRNSTISGNTAADEGGGILAEAINLSISHSTIVNNTSGLGGGGISALFSNPILSHSIVSGNFVDSSPQNLDGFFLSSIQGNYNLIGSGDYLSGEGNLNEIDEPLLGPLANNGGPTLTHALLPGSPAINAGDPNAFNLPDFDQRGEGFDRVRLGQIDIGAFEFEPFSTIIPDGGLVVDTNRDDFDGNYSAGDFSLREAIFLANANAGADTITFDSLVFNGGDDSLIRLGGTELEITETLTIDASDSVDVTITGDANDDDITDENNITDVLASFSGIVGAADDLRMDNSRVINFSASGGNLLIRGLTVTGGSASFGGGIRFGSPGAFGGSLILETSTISGNLSFGFGGGIYTQSGAISLSYSDLSENLAIGSLSHGGGIYSQSGSVSLSNSAVNQNYSSGTGGGISTESGELHVIDSSITGNISNSNGGGLYSNSGAIYLLRSTVSKNASTNRFIGYGGGLATSSGSISLDKSTVSGNQSSNSTGGIFSYFGPINLSSSTVSGNHSDKQIGGINAIFGMLTLSNSTIIENSAVGFGGGIRAGSNSLIIENSIIAGNLDNGTATDLRLGANTSIVINNSLIGVLDSGPIPSQQAVITGGTNNLTGTVVSPLEPLLSPLANNGGPTQTHALLPGSPALNAGDPSIPFRATETDQRGVGFSRVAFDRIDIGAYEAQVTPSADFDADGVVDGSDFLAWQRGFGSELAVRADGNSDDDTDVDASDLAAWSVTYGEGAVSGQQSEGSEASEGVVDAAVAALFAGPAGLLENETASELQFSGEQAVEFGEFSNSNSLQAITTAGLTEENSDSDSSAANRKKNRPASQSLTDELVERVFG